MKEKWGGERWKGERCTMGGCSAGCGQSVRSLLRKRFASLTTLSQQRDVERLATETMRRFYNSCADGGGSTCIHTWP